MLLTFEGRDYDLRPGESVLDAMSRHGVGLPAACRAGSCQACVIRSVSGDPGPEARRGLKATWLASGYFLACRARPAADLAIATAGEDARTPARLVSSRPIAPGVLRVLVQPDQPLDYRPGSTSHPLLLAGTGTGIAPLLAVARSALAQRHRGPVVLIHGASGPAALYLGTRCPRVLEAEAARAAAAGQVAAAGGPPGARPVLSWRTCLLSEGGDIADAVAGELGKLDGAPGRARAYLCGGARSVSRMRRALFMAGMSLADIYSDQFVPAAP